MIDRHLTAALCFWLLLSLGGFCHADDPQSFFEKKIRPVLVAHCYECHSATADEIGGKLRVDSRDAMRTGGESGPVLVVGDPDSSLLIQALRYDGLEMPPDEPLSPAIVRDFERWVTDGAVDPRTEPEHPPAASSSEAATDRIALWSFLPRSRAEVPAVDDTSWPKTPLDHFVLSEIENRELRPTRDSQPETLIRRLYDDLIGLPPTADQIADFVQQCQMDRQRAVECLVDGLLASPQFGVRWGRHWLDIARYGESNGDDGLGRNATFPHAWRYRDYVIDAFNADTPYDRFLTEQIAGDLLPATTAEDRNRQLIATGFLAIGSKPASAMNKNFAMDVVDDQINVVSTAVMGLSVACARCHDHKHDPIPTRDYYALAGIFRSTETLYGAAGNEKLTAPPTQLHRLYERLPQQQTPPDRTRTPQLPETHFETARSLQPTLLESLTKPPTALQGSTGIGYSNESFATTKESTLDADLDLKGNAYSVAFWFRNQLKNDARPITAYLFSRAKRDDGSLPGDHIGIGGNHQASRTGKLFLFNGNARKETLAGSSIIEKGSWNHVVFVRNGASVRLYLNGRVEIEGTLEATFGDNGHVRFASRSDHFAPLDGNLGGVAVFPRALNDEEALNLHHSSGQPRGVAPQTPFGLAMGVNEVAKPSDCKIHINGDGAKLGPSIPRGILTAYRSIQGAPSDLAELAIAPQSSGRQELAAWLTRPDHPQTARVMANRIWLHLFGRGIVETADDFGVYGSRPSHPRLLDHLANRFIDQRWSIKALIREIVLSRTYQLDSSQPASEMARDPDNTWLTRHQRRRRDAESIRDSILIACGSLDRSPGQGSDIETVDALINWPPGEATDLHRPNRHRSVYLCMLRHAPPDELAAFDLPDWVSVRGRRESTVLPTQTLFLMNSPLLIRESTRLAERLLKSQLSDNQRIEAAFIRVLSRRPTGAETGAAMNLVSSVEDDLQRIESQPMQRQRRAWATFCQSLLMTNEFRYVD